MNFLRRKLVPTESTAKNETQSIVHREIEIIVEREWITEIWHVPAGGGLEKVYDGQMMPELLPPNPPESVQRDPDSTLSLPPSAKTTLEGELP
jgi:hypothetical protein